MHPALAGLIGVVLTLAVLALVAITRRGLRGARDQLGPGGPTHEDVVRLVAAQPWGAVLAGGHDEILAVNPRGESQGLVRGTRLGTPELLELVRAARRDGDARSGELVGELFGAVTPLADGAVLVIADDLSEARRLDETRRDFLANVSHELKTPIGAISILAEAIGEAHDDPEAVQTFTARLGRESERLGELVRQIIELTRVQAAPTTNRLPVAVQAVVEEAVGRVQVRAAKREVALVLGPVTPARVIGDRHQLVVALANLIDNAVTCSDPGARVVVSATAERDAETVGIAVVDSGTGIRPADQERIFERFYRTDQGRSRERGGSGLGLAIVSHIASNHGGRVSLWSVPGQGSTFTLHLPGSAEPTEANR